MFHMERRSRNTLIIIIVIIIIFAIDWKYQRARLCHCCDWTLIWTLGFSKLKADEVTTELSRRR